MIAINNVIGPALAAITGRIAAKRRHRSLVGAALRDAAERGAAEAADVLAALLAVMAEELSGLVSQRRELIEAADVGFAEAEAFTQAKPLQRLLADLDDPGDESQLPTEAPDDAQDQDPERFDLCN